MHKISLWWFVKIVSSPWSLIKQSKYLIKHSHVSVCIRPLRKREGNWSRNACRKCFWDGYWWRTGQLLANVFPVPNNRTRNLCERLLGPVIPSHFWSGELRRQVLTMQLRDFINYIFLADFLLFFQDYLETKRLVFARFYFLSNEDLLDILANSKNPNAVQVSSDWVMAWSY